MKGYEIDDDGYLTIFGDVTLSKEDVDSRGRVQADFKEITGSLYCSGIGLKTLDGFPEKVGGHFDGSHNELTTLHGGPTDVGGLCDCSHNRLKSLDGSPDKVEGCFDCSNNPLKSLEKRPKHIGGDFITDVDKGI